MNPSLSNDQLIPLDVKPCATDNALPTPDVNDVTTSFSFELPN